MKNSSVLEPPVGPQYRIVLTASCPEEEEKKDEEKKKGWSGVRKKEPARGRWNFVALPIKCSTSISKRQCNTQPARRPFTPCSAAVWLWPDQGSYCKNVDFYKVFNGFRRNSKISGTAQIQTSRGQWAPVNSKQRHLKNTRVSNGFS